MLRRRIVGVLLALAVEILVVVLLLTLQPKDFGGARTNEGPKTFALAPPAEEHKATKAQKRVQKQATKTPPKTPPPATPVPPPPVPLGPIPGLLQLTREEYRAADIGKIKSKPVELADKGTPDDSADSGGSPGDSAVVGRAPNGEPLYDVEWYREPTQAQLGFYLPHNTLPGSAGLIACKTAPRYKVVDCVVLGDTPSGTAIARGVKEAAWQFQVLPPRKGGKQIIGAWVRIRIDITAHDK